MFSRKNGSFQISFLVALVGFLVTVTVTYSIVRTKRAENDRRLELEVKQIVDLHKDRMAEHSLGLQGVKGAYFLEKFAMTPDSFRRYARSGNFFPNFEGALGFGFIRKVPAAQLKTYLVEQQKFLPDFQIRPAGERSEYWIIERIEPAEMNQLAWGFDVRSEASRFAAGDLAMRSGELALTKKISLVQLPENKNAGVLLFLPVYRTLTTPSTEEARVQNLVGWVYSAIVLQDFFSGIAKNIPQDVLFSVTLNDEPIFANGYISKHAGLFTQSFPAYGQTWTITGTHIAQSFVHEYGSILFLVFFCAGSTALASFIVLRSLQRERHKVEMQSNWQKAVLNGSRDAIISTTPEGIITTFNQAAERMLGYSASELIGKASPAVFHDPNEVLERNQELSRLIGEEVTPGFATFATSALRKVNERVEWTYIRKDSSKFKVSLDLSVIYGEDGVLMGFLGVAEDLTTAKSMEGLIEKQRVQILNSAKMSTLGEMAGGVAHEINNPLAIINGKVNQIKRRIELGQLEPTRLLEDLHKVEETANRIARIVKGLRAFSRNSEADPMEVVPVDQIIKDTLELCAERFRNQQIKLEVVSSSLLSLECRATQISQVLMNLMSNAYDAVLTLEERWVKIEVETVGERLLISVTDSGRGIPRETVERMMEPFYTTKEVGRGTGLGLSIAKGICEEHQGSLLYDISTGHTRFIIDLPHAQNSIF